MTILIGSPVICNDWRKTGISFFGRVVGVEEETAYVRVIKVKSTETNKINTSKLQVIKFDELKVVDIRKRKARLAAQKKEKIHKVKQEERKASRIVHTTIAAPTGGRQMNIIDYSKGRKEWFDGGIYDAQTNMYFPADLLKDMDRYE